MEVELRETSMDHTSKVADSRMVHSNQFSSIEVRFKNLCVETDISTVERSLPTLFNYTLDAVKGMIGLANCTRKKSSMKILDGLNGIIRPSRMTLLLGPPGSGKSTLLQALAGKLDSSLKMRGSVTYNGRNLDCFRPQHTCAYVSQHDHHHAEMTVRETLEFSEQMLGTINIKDLLKMEAIEMNATGEISQENREFNEGTLGENDKEKKNLSVTNYILKKLSLQECADVIIGDQMRRGISGGQKKRVTIGEMLVGFSRCFFMDDISTGLDSSTTYEIIKFLRHMAHMLNLTMAISLLQPAQEIIDLFDDIILLCDGKIVYQGPREYSLTFFESVGFKCPGRKNTADFLQEVTSEMYQGQYWLHGRNSYRYVTVEQFEESSKSSSLLKQEPQHVLYKNNHAEHDLNTLSKHQCRISRLEVFRACFSREILLIKRNLLVHIFKNIQISILAFVLMTTFTRTKMHHHSVIDGNQFLGAIFSAVVVVKFNGMTELAMTMRRLPIFYKQKKLLCLPGWALLSSVFILSLPMSLIETGIWVLLTYFTIGFACSAIRFLRQFLALFCVHQMSMGLFRFIATIGRTQVMSNTLGSATLIAIYILGGFVISKDDIQPWLVWGSWISPLTYGQNAVAINEFIDERWNITFQYGNVTETVGKAVLDSRGLFSKEQWFWISVGALVGFSVFFNILSLFALEYLDAPRKYDSILSNRPMKTMEACINSIQDPNFRISMSFQPLTIVFKNINYYVDTPMEMRKHGYTESRLQLLDNVTGAFKPGILTALMGITGAGKTTLLDVLAGRKTGGCIEGNISISGYAKKQETFSRVSAYCEQTDVHSPFLTVLESLQYSAWLRLPSSVEAYERNTFVEEIADLVELKPLMNAMVGLPGLNGLSAEQRKRLTIAVELVSSPSIIFLDEPTTGLDACAAAIVMRTVRKTVDTGRTVVCTIHQPSVEIFEAFDELLLLKRGGQLIYNGKLGTLSQDMIQYFQAVQGVPLFKEGQNPAMWMMNVTSISMEIKLGINFADIYRNSLLFIKNEELIQELSSKNIYSADLNFSSRHERSFLSQCLACLWKQNLSYWKNPELNVIRFVTTLATSFLFGAVFWKIASNIKTEQDIFNILGVMYGSALFLGFSNASIIQPIIEMERIVFYRERSSGMYSSLPYAIAQVAIEIPYITVQAICFSIIVYPMIGFQLAKAKFFWFLLFLLLNFVYFSVFGMMTAALTPSQEIAALISFMLFVLWNLFSGFFISRKMIPVWWRWFYWVDPGAWTIYGLMASQLGDNNHLIKIPGGPDQSVKDFLNDYFGFQDSWLPLVVTVHILFIALFLFVFAFSIKHINFQTR